MLLFCFRLFCSPSTVASISEVINSAPLSPSMKSLIVQAALFVVRPCLNPYLMSIGEVINSAPLHQYVKCEQPYLFLVHIVLKQIFAASCV
jgi:hypothetical protein